MCVGNIGELIDSFAAASYTFYLLAFIALLILRITHPSVPRPFRVSIQERDETSQNDEYKRLLACIPFSHNNYG